MTDAALYQRNRRAEAKKTGKCSRCVTADAQDGLFTCRDCRRKPTDAPRPSEAKKVKKTQSYFAPQESEDVEIKLSRKPAKAGNCHKKGCPKRPAFEGVDYCVEHGVDYVKGLK